MMLVNINFIPISKFLRSSTISKLYATQFSQNHIVIAALLETRRSRQKVNQHGYHVLSSGAAKGAYGVELWLSLHQKHHNDDNQDDNIQDYDVRSNKSSAGQSLVPTDEQEEVRHAVKQIAANSDKIQNPKGIPAL